jgi:hypothetical protein
MEKERQKKIKAALDNATRFRNELAKKTGMTASSADIIREDRDHGH